MVFNKFLITFVCLILGVGWVQLALVEGFVMMTIANSIIIAHMTKCIYMDVDKSFRERGWWAANNPLKWYEYLLLTVVHGMTFNFMMILNFIPIALITRALIDYHKKTRPIIFLGCKEERESAHKAFHNGLTYNEWYKSFHGEEKFAKMIADKEKTAKAEERNERRLQKKREKCGDMVNNHVPMIVEDDVLEIVDDTIEENHDDDDVYVIPDDESSETDSYEDDDDLVWLEEDDGDSSDNYQPTTTNTNNNESSNDDNTGNGMLIAWGIIRTIGWFIGEADRKDTEKWKEKYAKETEEKRYEESKRKENERYQIAQDRKDREYQNQRDREERERERERMRRENEERNQRDRERMKELEKRAEENNKRQAEDRDRRRQEEDRRRDEYNRRNKK